MFLNQISAILILALLMYTSTNAENTQLLSMKWMCEEVPCEQKLQSLKLDLKFDKQQEGIYINEELGLVRIGNVEGNKNKNKKINLLTDLDIRAHTVEIHSDIITHGHRLNLLAYEVRVVGSKNIIAFDKPAEPQPGYDKSLEFSFQHGAAAESTSVVHLMGQTGNTGATGKAGDDNPGSISIQAIRVVGKLHISGNGQQGGRGQQGGMGGHGTHGLPGKNGYAKAHCTGGAARTAGNGRQGSYGGLGGKGGTGGTGGKNVEINILTMDFNEQLTFESKPGIGGLGGLVGLTGHSGAPGPGGAKAYSAASCRLFGVGYTTTQSVGPGARAPVTPRRVMSAQENQMQTGVTGQPFAGELSKSLVISINKNGEFKGLEDATSDLYSQVLYNQFTDELSEDVFSIGLEGDISELSELELVQLVLSAPTMKEYFNSIILFDNIKRKKIDKLKLPDLHSLSNFYNQRLEIMVNNLNYSENISYHKTLYGNIFKKLFKLLTTRFAFLDLNKQNSAIDISDETIQAYADSCAGLGEKLSALTKESTVENTVFFKDLMSFSYCAFLKSEKLTDFYKDNDINGEVSYK